MAHRFSNFAGESHSGFFENLLNHTYMAFIIMILCVFGWLGQALGKGADLK